MPTLTITLGFKTQELRALDLPVEIRKPNSALVARTSAAGAVTLRPGSYYASAELPGGQQLLHAFEIADQDLTIVLSPEPEDESRNEWQEVTHYLQAPAQPRRESPSRDLQGRIVRGLESAPGPAMVQARFRLFAGNPLTGSIGVKPRMADVTVHAFEQGRAVQFRVSVGQDPLIVQLIEPGAAVRNMVVAAAPFTTSLIAFSRRPDATCTMDVHLDHGTADMLLRYGASSSTSAAAQTSRSTLLDAERLLMEKGQDPIAAAVGGAAILRFGELKWLHDWTANLYRRFTWLPDGAAIHGEHLARRGKHVEAAACFVDVPERGLPLLSDALFYTVERLKWYAGIKPEEAPDIDQARVNDALEQLLPWATLAHRQRPITSYPGLDPRTPSSDPAPDSLKGIQETVELAEWLGDPGTRSNTPAGGSQSVAPAGTGAVAKRAR
jgi:hypothetical protein